MLVAQVTNERLAATCGVDVKTVGRWINNEGRIPHPNHRRSVADALGVDESVLWPDGVKQTIKTGPDREVVAVYPRRASAPTSVWRKLITAAGQRLIFAGYTSYFVWIEHPNLAAALRRKAEAGAQVRFLLGEVDGEVTRHRGQVEDVPMTVGTRIRSSLAELDQLRDEPGVEVRHSEGHIAMSVFIFDDDMLVMPHLANVLGHDSPMMHLRRQQDDGMFDRFASHVDWLWNDARPAAAA